MKTDKILVGTAAMALVACWASRAEEPRDQCYMSMDAGLALQEGITLKDTLYGGSAKVEMDPGFRFDVDLGFRLSSSWRIGLESGIIYNSVTSIGGAPISDSSASLDLYEFPLLFTVTYEIPPQGPLTAYVSAGVGGVATWFYEDQFNYSSDLTAGYQVAAGVNYELNKNWELGVAYKLLGTTERDFGDGIKADGNLTHSFLAALAIRF